MIRVTFDQADFIPTKDDDYVKSRHSRVGGNPESMELIEITGFPFSRE
jgi:hypothetical protein